MIPHKKCLQIETIKIISISNGIIVYNYLLTGDL